jgi:hypothetical protein
MGKVTYSPGIQFVQGALAKPKKMDGHNHGDYLIGTHRVAATTNPDCTRLYIRKGNAYERSTPVTANETWARTRFEAVALAVRARQTDLMNINTDKEAFLAQRDQANGKRTFKSYLWSVCGAAYDQAHPRS